MVRLILNNYLVILNDELKWICSAAPHIAEHLNTGAADIFLSGYYPDKSFALAEAAVKLYGGRILEYTLIKLKYKKDVFY